MKPVEELARELLIVSVSHAGDQAMSGKTWETIDEHAQKTFLRLATHVNQMLIEARLDELKNVSGLKDGWKFERIAHLEGLLMEGE